MKKWLASLLLALSLLKVVDIKKKAKAAKRRLRDTVDELGGPP